MMVQGSHGIAVCLKPRGCHTSEKGEHMRLFYQVLVVSGKNEEHEKRRQYCRYSSKHVMSVLNRHVASAQQRPHLGAPPSGVIREVGGVEVVLRIPEGRKNLHVRLHVFDHVDVPLLRYGLRKKSSTKILRTIGLIAQMPRLR